MASKKKAPGVMTSSDFLGKDPPEGTAKAAPSPVSTPEKKQAEIRYRVRFGPAPLGKSCTSFTYKGDVVRINMVDGIYEFPKGMERGAAEAFMRELVKRGFVNASVSGRVPVKPEPPVAPKRYEYTVGHPDNEPENGITGSVSVTVKGIDTKFECVDGIVRTRDKAVYEAFLKKGWYEVSIEEIEEKVEEGKS